MLAKSLDGASASGRAVLSPATPDGIVRSLVELAPVVITGTGPTYEQRDLTKLPLRKRL
jgi:hypothetical protein